jgi:hypothetical protein
MFKTQLRPLPSAAGGGVMFRFRSRRLSTFTSLLPPANRRPKRVSNQSSIIKSSHFISNPQ